MTNELEIVIGNTIRREDVLGYKGIVYKLTMHEPSEGRHYFTIQHPQGDLMNVFKSPALADMFTATNTDYLYVNSNVVNMYNSAPDFLHEIIFYNKKGYLSYTIDEYQAIADKFDLDMIKYNNTIKFRALVGSTIIDLVEIEAKIEGKKIIHKVMYEDCMSNGEFTIEGYEHIHGISQDLQAFFEVIQPNHVKHYKHLTDILKRRYTSTISWAIGYSMDWNNKHLIVNTPEVEATIAIEDKEGRFASITLDYEFSDKREFEVMSTVDEVVDFLLNFIEGEYGDKR